MACPQEHDQFLPFALSRFRLPILCQLRLNAKTKLLLTRSVNSQLALTFPGVSGRQKYARMATGRDITPLITFARN
jgi:hypothetical protein